MHAAHIIYPSSWNLTLSQLSPLSSSLRCSSPPLPRCPFPGIRIRPMEKALRAFCFGC